MSIFKQYAGYYDLLYKDKDYAAEIEFVLSKFGDVGVIPTSILELGCGTGKHAMLLAEKGVKVVGVDLSEAMLTVARNRCLSTLPDDVLSPTFFCDNVQNFRMDMNFDTVLSLFHVMSYQNTEDEALATLQTAYSHLKPGGLFLFDFWFGAGVLSDPPTYRWKRFENESTTIERRASPSHFPERNVVEVHYDITMRDNNSNVIESFSEDHSMRYWFLPELKYLGEQQGFSFVSHGAWMLSTAVERTTWNAWMLLRKD